MKNFLSEFQAISVSGDPTRHEDMDFVLENVNKKSKSWIPRGVPTNKHWLRVFRNFKKLDQVHG